jgi:uncharacterized protein (TIGR03086 family)
MTDIADRYRRLAAAFAAKIEAVPPDAWTSPTPCSDWDVRALVGHVVGVHGMMLGFIGRDASPGPDVEEDPAGAFASARADIETVLDDPELAATEYDGALGRTNIAATVDRFLDFDLVVHGWDLARATGQDETIDDAEVARIWKDTEALGDNLRRSGVCGPEVPVADDAPLADRLLGRLGRDPGSS